MYWTIWILTFVLTYAGLWLVTFFYFQPFNINRFFDRVMLQFGLANPEIMTTLRIFEKIGYHGHNKLLNDESDAHKRAQETKVRKNLKALQLYEADRLRPRDRLSKEIMEWFLKDMVEGQEFSYHNYPVNQLFGAQNQLPTFLTTMHQINNRRDAKYFIERLSRVGVKFTEIIEGLRIREELGVIPPRFVFDKVIAEMESFIGKPPQDNILYTSLAEKLGRAKGLGEHDRDGLLNEASVTIERTVYPAYQTLIDYFAELKAKATDDDGVWKLPQGDKYYQYLLKHYTTTELSAEDWVCEEA